ncbi:MAG: histidine kinase [Wenzhouxiangellaceae bacterium]|nr:histidine kinase [Wenzhouxiangellaceae bacterium]
MQALAELKPSDLPDFCHPRAVLLLVMLGLLLAIVLSLAASPGFSGFWVVLGLTGLMVEAVVLGACLLLCICRGWLSKMPAALAYTVIFVVIQLLVVLSSWIVINFLFLPGAGQSPALEWLLRNVIISSVASLIFLRYLILHRQWRAQVRAESEARLDALQARIRPHFLFNALNTIASLIHRRPQDAEQAVLDLSDLLRTGLRGKSAHTLEEELELVRGYLRIEALRLGDRLKIDWQLDDELPLDQTLPALLIQPLVENAIVHGIAQCDEGGTLSIHAARHGRKFSVTVENPLPGISASGTRKTDTGNQMALENIRQRLELGYDDQADLETAHYQGRFRARITLPVEAD